MKRFKTLSSLILLFLPVLIPALFAQQANLFQAECAPQLPEKTKIEASKAMWDYQFGFSAEDATNGDVGMAGIAFFNNEFIVSRWNCDTLYRFDLQGNLISEFQNPALWGVRGITTDGTWLYMSTANYLIYRINPSDFTIDSTINTLAGHTARFATYDATLDGGKGGFWIGDFNTDITALNMKGVVLRTIPYLTHTLSGMYGAAVDNSVPGTSTLWVFNQATGGRALVQGLNLADGTPNGESYDLEADGNTYFSTTGLLAGGAFFTTDFFNGKGTLMCLAQVSNSVMCYTTSEDLDDVSLEGISMQLGYSQLPLSQTSNLNFDISYKNTGTYDIAAMTGVATVYYNGNDVAGFNFSATNLQPGDEGTYTVTYTPNMGTGSYELRANVDIDGGITDMYTANNSQSLTFEVSDSVFARDNGIMDGTSGFSIPSVNSGWIISEYTLSEQDTLTGIWIKLVYPLADYSTCAIIFQTTEGLPGNEITRGEYTMLDETVNDYYLTFPEPVILAPGTYAFGCFQDYAPIFTLACSNSIYTPGVQYYFVDDAWTATPVDKSLFIRPVFATLPNETSTRTSLSGKLSVYPVPASETLHINLDAPAARAGKVELTDLSGRLVLSTEISKGTSVIDLELPSCTPGMYMISVTIDAQRYSAKVVIR